MPGPGTTPRSQHRGFRHICDVVDQGAGETDPALVLGAVLADCPGAELDCGAGADDDTGADCDSLPADDPLAPFPATGAPALPVPLAAALLAGAPEAPGDAPPALPA